MNRPDRVVLYIFGACLFVAVFGTIACGSGGGPSDNGADLVDVAVPVDTHVVDAADTVVRDTATSDNGVPDVVVPDTAVTDTSVSDTSVQDAVVVDSVGDDVVCVPDCSGGACTDDGCGGDCCADGMVCETSWIDGQPVCLPIAGYGCSNLVECMNYCAEAECATECYVAGSATARAAFAAYAHCMDVACPGGDSVCAEQAEGPGGECYDEVVVCLNDCTADCSGGECTDDGCGGDCCAPDGVCETPEGGGAPVCVTAVAGTTCMEVIECLNNCIDNECAQACVDAGSTGAQTAFYALYACLDENCAGQGDQCVNPKFPT